MKNKIMLFVVIACLTMTGYVFATSITLDVWHLGEDDAGAAAGNATTGTTSLAAGTVLGKFGTGTAKYDSRTPVAGSSLSVLLDGNCSLRNPGYGTPPTLGFVYDLGTDNWGMEGWVYSTKTGGAGGWAFANGRYFIGQWEGSFLWHRNGGGNVADAPLTPNVWVHMALVRNAGTLTAYLNGVPRTSTNRTDMWDSEFCIGARGYDGGERWLGLVDHVRLFKFEGGKFDPNDLSFNKLQPDGAKVGEVSTRSVSVVEGGVSQAFQVSLLAAPQSDVVVTVSPGSTDPNNPNYRSTAKDIFLNSSPVGQDITLTFTPADWAAKTVTISAYNDTAQEALETAFVTFELASADTNFDKGFIPAVVVKVYDNDSAGLLLTGAGTGELVVAEGGVGGNPVSDTFTVSLSIKPTADVIITPNEVPYTAPDTDPNDLVITPKTLTFTPVNYATPQTITVTAVDDTLVESNPEPAGFDLDVTSTDTSYNGFQYVTGAADVVASVLENECIPTLSADLNMDCTVDLKDFAELAAQWLKCSWPNVPDCE